MGAHFARPDVPVFDIAGDGSIQMNIQEFGTLASDRIPVKVVILNNMYLGMVRSGRNSSTTAGIRSPNSRRSIS